MPVENFITRVKVMVRYVKDIPFPGVNPPMVDDTKLKNIIFCTMLPAWHTNFLRVNHISTTSVLKLQQSMAQDKNSPNQCRIHVVELFLGLKDSIFNRVLLD
jgi:hypothetical protein